MFVRKEKQKRFCDKDCYAEFKRTRPKPATRACTKCHVVLPYDEHHFQVRKRYHWGLTPICKPCTNRLSFQTNKDSRVKLKIDVLTAYGGGKLACMCCGEKNLEFLTLDHIYGDGSQERKSLPAHSLFRKLRRDNFPQGRYRTLCMNCNFAFGKFGYCPHTKVPEVTTPDSSQ